jgi:hypothetical protein
MMRRGGRFRLGIFLHLSVLVQKQPDIFVAVLRLISIPKFVVINEQVLGILAS